MLSHDNYVFTITQQRKKYQFTDSEVMRIVSYLPLSHVAAQLIDIIGSCRWGAHIYFANPDALSGSLINTLKEVRPTMFFSVPRVWEKIYDQMQLIAKSNGAIKTKIATWAKSIGKEGTFAQTHGLKPPLCFGLADKLVYNNVKKALGLDQAKYLIFGAAPLSPVIREYFLSLNMYLINGYGMSECGGVTTLAEPLHFDKFDDFFMSSTGKTMEGTELKIDQPDKDGNGEICYRGRHIFMGYFKDEESTRNTIDKDRWLHSGDVGKLDNKGNLTITGRIKELIITAGGENVAPVLIENEFKKTIPIISNCMVIGDKRKYLSILLTLKHQLKPDGTPTDQLHADVIQIFKELGSNAMNLEEAKKDTIISNYLQKLIDDANTRVISKAQYIRKWTLIPSDFSVDGGELTPTLKLKRRIVEQKWINEIEKIKRPLSKKEIKEGQKDIVEVQGNTVIIREPRVKVDLTKFMEEFPFNFDAAIDQYCSNEELYKQLVQPLVQAAINGTKITCFAYGQTGSGKTYTMLGDQNVIGIYTLAAFDLFQMVSNSINLSVSLYEIYCSKLFDLLNDRQQLISREDAKGQVNIAGLSECKVNNVQEFLKTVEMGIKSRITAQNSVNQDSSRSHAILQINLRQSNKITGKLSFIDLAGSERGADVVEYHRQTRIDGAEINKSLLALKECIRALDLNKNHTPFRGSKLTQVLKDSFTGNCRTLMIGTISSCHKDAEHSLNTLRYADRVKELRTPQYSNTVDQLARELMLPRQYNINNHLFEGPSAPRSISPPKLFEFDEEEDEITYPNSNNHNFNLKDKHEEIIQKILKEERTLKTAHRDHIDDLVDLINEDMKLLQIQNQPNSIVEDYVDELNRIISLKIGQIKKLRLRLQQFKQHLIDEQDLSLQCQTHFYQKQHQN